jgi:hypothetical protein
MGSGSAPFAASRRLWQAMGFLKLWPWRLVAAHRVALTVPAGGGVSRSRSRRLVPEYCFAFCGHDASRQALHLLQLIDFICR